jgi:tRNA pseudouridine13 synthase
VPEIPCFRLEPEDFVVEEIPAYSPSGEGAHTFVYVEKRLLTTDGAARQLASLSGVPPRDVGYAGRKDRRAVTRQWMSVPGLDPEKALSARLKGMRILKAVPHGHKLRTGQLRGNRFEIRVANVTEGVESRARKALDEIMRRGMPNRFGEQRFGHAGRNSERGRALLLGEISMRDRRKARFMISALQSEVFNRALAARSLPLDVLEEGDVAQVVESGGLFVVEDPKVENQRASRFEISATGPIFGTKMMPASGAVALREEAWMGEFGIPLGDALQPPRGIRIPGTRRPYRVALKDPVLAREGEAIRLGFELPAGSYATVLLEELFGEIREARIPGRNSSAVE